jgi:uncharacterized CHY-type Zn-finger protein
MRRRTASLLFFAASALGLVSALNFAPSSPPAAGKWTLVAWNDLGMHCLDADYSVFSILPPFNNVFAQLVTPTGQLVDVPTGFTLTYEAVADATGSTNKSSIGKTNYWTYAPGLYGASAVPDTGLMGNDMPGPANTPQPLSWDPAAKAWSAVGVPIVPFNDAGHHRTYPLLRIVARDANGIELASCTPVLPVSDEMDCRLCHGSGAGPDAEPAAGWAHDPNSERDYRLNILRLHDERQAGNGAYTAALAQLGFSPLGLQDSVVAQGKSVLCGSCHATNALGTPGVPGAKSLTSAMHAGHANVIDPINGLTLDSSENRSACYRCHPGSETKCLRGAMGSAVAPDGELAMQCQSCHANMSKVGDPARQGWLDEPNCQACHTGTATHNNGQIVYTDAFEPNGTLRIAVDATYATNPNTPTAPYSLYKLSEGHGGLSCEACHGSTHAEFPGLHPNDNLVSQQVQGHSGMLADCSSCHNPVPNTTTGGPHGLHTIGQAWINAHPDVVEHQGAAQCQACHGVDAKGTLLSQAQAARSFSTKYGTKSYFDGQRVTCYDCHKGPNSDDVNPNGKPVAQDGAITVGAVPVAIALVASDPNGNPLTYRIITQPPQGRVGLSGNQATYHPDPGYAGPDSFTFAASDGQTESNLGRITVTRLANWANYGLGYAGTAGAVPGLTLVGVPTLGSTVPVAIGNSSGFPSLAFLVVSPELANQPTGLGGALLTEPQSILGVALAAGGTSLPWSIPSQISLIGATIYAQTAQFDAQAAWDWSFSRGLRVTLGQ